MYSCSVKQIKIFQELELTKSNMRANLVLMVLTIITTLTVLADSFVAEGGTLVDIASRTCQLSSFCTKDSSLPVPKGSNTSMTSCCYPCSCSRECLEFNNCCPDYQPAGHVPDDLKTIPCKQTNYMGNAHGRFYYIVDACPTGYPDKDVRTKCSGATPPESILDITIVWSPSKRRIYQNHFCASCHDAVDVILWKPLLQDCFAFMESNNITDIIARTDRACQLYFEPDFNSTVLEHLVCFNTDFMVDTCDVVWGPGNNDVILHDACVSGQVVPYSYYDTIGEFVMNELILFKNVFCFLCNYQRFVRGDELCKRLTNAGSDSRSSLFVPITVLLNLKLFLGERSARTCANDEMDDVMTGTCRKIYCQLYDVAVNGECVPQIAASTGLPITMNFKLVPSRSLLSYYADLTDNLQKEQLLVTMMNVTLDLQNELFIMGCGRCHTSVIVESNPITGELETLIVQAPMFTTDTCSDVDIRKQRHTLLKKGTTVLASDNENISLTFQTHVIFEDYRNVLPDIQRYQYENCNFLNWRSTKVDTHFCSYTELNAEDYAMALSTGFLKADEWVCPLGSTNDPECSNTTRKQVCLSWYGHDAQERSEGQQPTNTWHASGIVSFVCTCLSAVCLLATMFTFGCFKKLRQLPSGIILLVSTNLLLSQLLYVFGLGRTEYLWVCFGFGVAIHYFVLAYVFTLNAYMILVYRTLRSSYLQTSHVNIFAIVFYIYGSPLVLIATNMVVSYYSAELSLGYGGEYCFISSANMRRYVLATPILVIVCCNCCLLGLTLKQIRSATENLPSDIQERRSNQMLYLRLSILTGTSWLFGFIHEVSSDPFTEYCFIVLNAGQGFFIMVGFVCKRKIFEMYKHIFDREVST